MVSIERGEQIYIRQVNLTSVEKVEVLPAEVLKFEEPVIFSQLNKKFCLSMTTQIEI